MMPLRIIFEEAFAKSSSLPRSYYNSNNVNFDFEYYNRIFGTYFRYNTKYIKKIKKYSYNILITLELFSATKVFFIKPEVISKDDYLSMNDENIKIYFLSFTEITYGGLGKVKLL